MTPKAKANSIFNKMYKYQLDKSTSLPWLVARKCALVLVDEVINIADEGKVTIGRNALSDLEYWNEVLTELKKL